MKITFIGTRGYIDAKSRRHRRHSSAIISYRSKRVMIDCGLDWRKKVWKVNPDSIVITHGHPDHAFGLKDGSPCPVYATEPSWEIMKRYPIPAPYRYLVKERKPFKLYGITFEAFSVLHSLIAPAVGYRISGGRVLIFYVPDLVYINERYKALKDVQIYIGDGATITNPIIRLSGPNRDVPIGHTPIRTQLTWCKKEKVPRAIFTHCGSKIVEGDERVLGAKIRAMAKERGVEVEIAYDGMELFLR
ncbi:MBL fold metallo-hydrolase [Candidatus Dependentiae bacterium]|nr:MAG: MBL fold metallo-hydrolase [Candidatus Dependentiae bacterium]